MANRVVKLICITEANNNKYYNLTDNGSTISVEYGRVGATCQTASYPSSKWSSLISSKLKKGYKDVTSLFTIEPTGGNSKGSKVDLLDISDRYISEMINKLQAYTKRQVSTNYLVTSDTVTKKQVDEAQSIINHLLTVKNNDQLNRYLLELFAVIPRKMAKVSDHIFNVNESFDYGDVEKVIGKEQELLDTMSQQVNQSILVKDNCDDKITLLDALGLEIFNVLPEQEELVKRKLAGLKDNYIRAFRVENKKTNKRHQSFLEKCNNKKTELFFHGSRNENWLPILETGLVLRPTNAVITGKMFGYGLYFADKAQKSWGYTSARGSYWAKGNASEAYMALFSVHTGDQLRIKRHEGWCSSLTEDKLKAKGKYDSIFAEGGADLRNNEYIIYNEAQASVKYLVQMKS